MHWNTPEIDFFNPFITIFLTELHPSVILILPSYIFQNSEAYMDFIFYSQRAEIVIHDTLYYQEQW